MIFLIIHSLQSIAYRGHHWEEYGPFVISLATDNLNAGGLNDDDLVKPSFAYA